jgi:hypothetical protein
MLLGLRRRPKRLPPRPIVPTGEDDFCGAVIDGRRLTVRDLAQRNLEWMQRNLPARGEIPASL